MILHVGNVIYVDFKDKSHLRNQKKHIQSEQTLTQQKIDRLQSSIARINKLCEELRLGTLPSDDKE